MNVAESYGTQVFDIRWQLPIYATLWSLKFPRYGDDYIGCEWVRVTAQGVPAHIGTPTRGFGYDEGDPYAEFLPPPVEVNADGDSEFMRAVVIVTEETQKSTARSAQEYVNPLLVLSGRDYASISFVELHERICDALRGKGSTGCGTVVHGRRWHSAYTL